MKVLYVLHSTNPDGSTQSFLTMAKGMVELGVSIMIVGPTPRVEFLRKIEGLGVEYKDIHIAENTYPSINQASKVVYYLKILNLFRRRMRFYRELYTVVKQYKPDVIHTNCGTINEGFRVSRKLNIPHVWHIREHQGKNTIWRPFPNQKSFERKLQLSNVITITHELMRYYNLEPNLTRRVIYNGILPHTSKIYLWPKDKYFLVSSRISEEKGIDDVIEAFAIFCCVRNDYKLIILGDGDESYVQHLKNRVNILGCESYVEWKGYVTDVLSYMQKATSLIVASKYEGFGRMTAEALINGCAVIGRNNSGTKEILEYTGGFLFNTNEEMLNCMHKVAALQETDYLSLMESAQNKAVDAYCTESHVNQVFKFYQDVLV